MKRFPQTLTLLLVLVLFGMVGCGGAKPLIREQPPVQQAEGSSRTITAMLLQLNDVYEITPVQGGQWGGLARVATLLQRLKAENPNTYSFIAGDFYSPSAIGTAEVEGERLAGKQMVAVLNAMGLDYVTFGNHEFDVSRDQFYQRLSESDFTYISSNVFDENGQPFPGVLDHHILKAPGQPGDTLRIGLVGVTLDSNPEDYVSYTDPLDAVKTRVAALTGRTDAQVAITHLALQQDVQLAEAVPELDLIMGGHEHENWYVERGSGMTPIAKADANARTAYLHHLRFNPETGDVSVRSRLLEITEAVPEDSATAQVVESWVELAFDGFRQQGLKPKEQVVTLPEPLDGRESTVRNRSSTLTDLLAEAMVRAAPGAELSIFNGGSIRIDDVIPPGPLIEYDVIRILPFGGDVVSVDMKGSLLDSVLTQGVANQGTGGFLHHANVDQQEGQWHVGGQPIDPARLYRVATSDFLVEGLEQNLDYLNFNNPGLTAVGQHGDIRLAMIAELKRRYGGP